MEKPVQKSKENPKGDGANQERAAVCQTNEVTPPELWKPSDEPDSSSRVRAKK